MLLLYVWEWCSFVSSGVLWFPLVGLIKLEAPCVMLSNPQHQEILCFVCEVEAFSLLFFFSGEGSEVIRGLISQGCETHIHFCEHNTTVVQTCLDYTALPRQPQHGPSPPGLQAESAVAVLKCEEEHWDKADMSSKAPTTASDLDEFTDLTHLTHTALLHLSSGGLVWKLQ